MKRGDLFRVYKGSMTDTKILGSSLLLATIIN